MEPDLYFVAAKYCPYRDILCVTQEAQILYIRRMRGIAVAASQRFHLKSSNGQAHAVGFFSLLRVLIISHTKY